MRREIVIGAVVLWLGGCGAEEGTLRPDVDASQGGTGGSDAGATPEGSAGQGGLDANTGGQGGLDANTGGQAGLDANVGGQGGLDAGTGGQAGLDANIGGQGGLDANTGGQAGLDANTGGQGGLDASTDSDSDTDSGVAGSAGNLEGGLEAEAGPCVLSLNLGSTGSHAQPTGVSIPGQLGCLGNKPSGLASVFACQCDLPGVCNIGAACSVEPCDNGQNSTCEATLWHDYMDNTCIPSNLSGLNPYQEGGLTPETFHPTCPLTLKLVTRGQALFKNIFGWYNASSAKPAISDLHPLLDCTAAVGTVLQASIHLDPAYLGGNIGFFLGTPEDTTSGVCKAGDCCASLARLQAGDGQVYYSERAYNPDDDGGVPFIHVLIYASEMAAGRYFYAWEDKFKPNGGSFTSLVVSLQAQ